MWLDDLGRKIERIRVQILEDEDEDIVGNLVAADSSKTVRRHAFLSFIPSVLEDIYTRTSSPKKIKTTVVAELEVNHIPVYPNENKTRICSLWV